METFNIEFVEIPKVEKDVFRATFQSYLEEVDLLVGRSITPDFNERFPEYDTFFSEDPDRKPFKINLLEDGEVSATGKNNVGFFLLKLISPEYIPKGVPMLYSEKDCKIAWLTDFFIKPQWRGKGLSWEFYESIIQLATDPINKWHVAWECDVKNTPAIYFYDKILKRIEENISYKMTKEKYQKNNRDYFYYQVQFDFDSQISYSY